MIPIATSTDHDSISALITAAYPNLEGYSVSCASSFVDYKNAAGTTNSVGCAISSTETTFKVRHSNDAAEVGCPMTDSAGTSIKIIGLDAVATSTKWYICAPSACTATVTTHQCDKLIDGGVDVQSGMVTTPTLSNIITKRNDQLAAVSLTCGT
jgi:hypothetical protein